ncbi:MAG: Rpn family recombination-promoting nuclease/putative transposase [Muribaculaceae bacterium]|nr:Rpn family recombination-promoting nuclease/putative transposase [Muribaculaceae bacterium]
MKKKRKEYFMNLRNDVAFKIIFGTPAHAELLMRFLNSMFSGEKTITKVEFKNKEVLPLDKDGKRMVYDVYCTNQRNEYFILEMQNVYEPYFENRALLYALKGLTEQVKKGHNYYLDPVFAIFLTNFDFEHLKKGISHDFGLIDRNTREEFTNLLNMRFIPMSSVKKTWNDCRTSYDKILFLIKNIHKMDKNSDAYRSREYDDFFDAAELDNLAEEDFVAYSQSYAKMEETERAMEYMCSQSFSKGEAAGFAKGESVGFAKGEFEGFRKTAIKLKDLGFDTATIADATGLTLEEINQL